MTEECLEFRLNSNLWKFQFLLAVPIGLLSLSSIRAMFITLDGSHVITSYAFLISFCVLVGSIFFKMGKSKAFITRYALHFGSQSFYFRDIKEIILNDPMKILLRLDGGAMEYQTIIKLNDIAYEQQGEFLEEIRKISVKIQKDKIKKATLRLQSD